MRKATRLAWRRTLRALRAECEPLLPVRVRLLRGPRPYYGATDLAADRSRFNTTVFREIQERDGTVRPLTRGELIDTLVHEWAHALAWAGNHDLEAHDALWGVAYARCYQAVVED